MVKIVEKGYRDCTVTLDGSECAVEFPSNYRVFSAQNMSDSDIVMSVESGRTAEDDGVRIIEAGCCGMLAHMRSDINTVYVTGTGKVHISAGNEAVLPFKSAGKGGDTINACGNPVQLDGLQGGVPFAEIAVSGKNLLLGIANVYPNVNNTLAANANAICAYAKCNPNSTYTIQRIGGTRLQCMSTQLPPDINIAYSNLKVASDQTSNSIIYTTSADARYIAIYLSGSAEDVSDIQIEAGDTATAYEPPITGRDLTLNVNGTNYTITPDSNPYTIPNDIRQQEGLNNISASAGELSVTGSLKNSALKKVWDKLDELATAIIVSNGEI